jgi:hypothetical protein
MSKYITPVMYIDSSGEFSQLFSYPSKDFSTKYIESYMKGREIIAILTGEVYSKRADGIVTIVNSSKINNPLIIIAYSHYLKYVKYPDYFTGSASGIAAEWIGHNIAYYGTLPFKSIDFMNRANNSAKHTDLAPAIYKGNGPEMNIVFYGIQYMICPAETRSDLIYMYYDNYIRKD